MLTVAVACYGLALMNLVPPIPERLGGMSYAGLVGLCMLCLQDHANSPLYRLFIRQKSDLPIVDGPPMAFVLCDSWIRRDCVLLPRPAWAVLPVRFLLFLDSTGEK